MKCFHPMCNDRSALFRVNAKGEKGMWACSKHIKQTDAKVDHQVKAIVDAMRRAPR